MLFASQAPNIAFCFCKDIYISHTSSLAPWAGWDASFAFRCILSLRLSGSVLLQFTRYLKCSLCLHLSHKTYLCTMIQVLNLLIVVRL